MDKFVVRATDPSDLPPGNQLSIRPERPWCSTTGCKKRVTLLSAYEIHGRILPAFKPFLTRLMLSSYSEFAALNQDQKHPSWFPSRQPRTNVISPFVTTIDFDSKGIYLASGNNAGRLFIHEFETLYCNAEKGSDQSRALYLRCFPVDKAVQAVRWNPSNEDEVACVTTGSNLVYFYDVACETFLPSEVLKVKSLSGWGELGGSVGLFDLAFFKIGKSRLVACGKDGRVHLWDRRSSKASYATMTVHDTEPSRGLNSIQLSSDEQMLYCGSEGGYIYLWDLRGGKNSAFVSSAKDYNQPVAAIRIENQLRKISSLRAQTDICPSSVDAISLNPACEKQLAFHLSCGWSGVLDMSTLDVTHIHCPPPPWSHIMSDQRDSISVFSTPGVATVPTFQPRTDVRRRKPVWLNTFPVYAVGSGSDSKVHMLDFTLGPKSRYSLDHYRSNSEKEWQTELRTSEAVVAIASHPLNDTLVAGCEEGKLLLIGQKKSSVAEHEISEIDLESKVPSGEGSAFGAKAE
ncbi:hypothetical protein MPTK1_1g11920 [Marchantia polymorpha subsp. ruderalis]|uniref:Uncharacterized protein n=3 Tax=Marchantia polymorpha TaxID=3197 RepID=A0AAF6AP65_MARPO|nr:hypothetical protein MARPO_0014s0037 [Marchantia polymorpha]BBM98234.1 hypothetical protein Mp_1g11910 [Marchantia polymorpha subsp. ruderalis]BBM98235.1 hypothetical protein Mp_1g11920 [Marchantia polymorpha subsp. ruderalis]|eukprot:PTQ45487.1 hypothetical protein MARPO_0014s0037 [Marchantia polymorpha]